MRIVERADRRGGFVKTRGASLQGMCPGRVPAWSVEQATIPAAPLGGGTGAAALRADVGKRRGSAQRVSHAHGGVHGARALPPSLAVARAAVDRKAPPAVCEEAEVVGPGPLPPPHGPQHRRPCIARDSGSELLGSCGHESGRRVGIWRDTSRLPRRSCFWALAWIRLPLDGALGPQRLAPSRRIVQIASPLCRLHGRHSFLGTQYRHGFSRESVQASQRDATVQSS